MTFKEKEFEKHAGRLLEIYSEQGQPPHTSNFLFILCEGDSDTFQYSIEVFLFLVDRGYVKKRNEAVPYNYKITKKGHEYLRELPKPNYLYEI